MEINNILPIFLLGGLIGFLLLLCIFINFIYKICEKYDKDFCDEFDKSHPKYLNFMQDWYDFNQTKLEIDKRMRDIENKLDFYKQQLNYYIPSDADISYDFYESDINTIFEFINSLSKEQFMNLSLPCFDLQDDKTDKDLFIQVIQHSNMKYDFVKYKIRMHQTEFAGVEVMKQSLIQSRINYLKDNFDDVLKELNDDLHSYKNKYKKQIISKIQYLQSIYDYYIKDVDLSN